jgi:hypothetical protein
MSFQIQPRNKKDIYFLDTLGRLPLSSGGYPAVANLSAWGGSITLLNLATDTSSVFSHPPSTHGNWELLTPPIGFSAIADGVYQVDYLVTDDSSVAFGTRREHLFVSYDMEDKALKLFSEGKYRESSILFGQIDAIKTLLLNCAIDEAVGTFLTTTINC